MVHSKLEGESLGSKALSRYFPENVSRPQPVRTLTGGGSASACVAIPERYKGLIVGQLDKLRDDGESSQPL